MAEEWEEWIDRWQRASVLDPETAEKIRRFEQARQQQHRWEWPVLVALGLGAAAISAGIVLFVSAHWDDIGNGIRLLLIVLMLCIFHVGGCVRFGAIPSTFRDPSPDWHHSSGSSNGAHRPDFQPG